MVEVKEHWQEEESVPKYAHYYDNVEKPKHYNSGPMECWDIEELLFGTEALCDHLRLTSYEYRFRAHQKNGEEDIRKAEKCEAKLKQLMDKIEMGERMHE